jgi:hypothetical protein
VLGPQLLAEHDNELGHKVGIDLLALRTDDLDTSTFCHSTVPPLMFVLRAHCELAMRDLVYRSWAEYIQGVENTSLHIYAGNAWAGST